MSKKLLDEVNRTIRKHNMLAPGDLCLVAVSGGPDSMALAHLLWRLRENLGVGLQLAHFNHGLRPEALRDEEMVARFAKNLGLPLLLGRGRGGRSRGRSVEEAARQDRYSFLERTREGVGATKIALAHTADDQVETILMNLFRGAGTQGLAGMLPVREGVFIRPLLESWRKQVAEYCQSEGLQPTFDETNLDLRFTRNWVRLRLMPLLDQRFAGWRKAVLRSGRLAAQLSQDFLEWVGEVKKKCVLAMDGAHVVVSVASLNELTPALRGAVLRDCLAGLAGSLKDVGQGTIGELWALATSRTGYGIREIRKGLWVEKDYDRLRLFRSEKAPQPLGPPPWEQVSLQVPGQVRVPELGLTMSAAEAGPEQARKATKATGTQEVQGFDLMRIGRSLTVRPWLPGDKFSPPGLQGHKKLQDLFVDEKVSRQKRGRIPVVTGKEGNIVWIVGYAVDARMKAGPDTRKAAILSAVWSTEEAGT